jgi:hypothetical protein
VSVRLGAETARDVLVRSRLWLAAGVASVVVCATGMRERASDSSGADRALLDFTLPLVVPLTCYAVFAAFHGRARTSTVLEPLARHGADRHALALGAFLVLGGACALTTALLTTLAVLSASATGVGLLRDLDACAWGGALAGAAYAGLFAVGSRRGRAGRLWILAGDWLLGSGTGVLALPWARAHTRGLLGGTPVLDGSPAFAATALAILATLCLIGCARRGPR